ncbi:DUF3349 domain-containing protein [Clavibacter tessellarius]|uniref:DUF3349 domain-containing protein n=1 Tax=Clavibacter tessellarius TaxID=31965 RepID=A0A225CIB0_9MICO|nr:DUF3349 domain-containing protein [Clavibacter michiganensis]OQJ62136.1 hypothetical protein B5P24_03445 [Clavibacter michiganensis subsp. tessellarius]UKF34863.1 DUF3349 domain-containing protein [Clavibacter michiganensis subsp. tessellarius]
MTTSASTEGGPAEGAAPERGIVQRVVGWLRAGYPSGVPDQDYVPLLGILRRSLTAEELEQVVDQLVDDAAAADAAGHEIGRRQLRERVEELLLGPALPEDLVRVSARLAAAGWPLGSPDDLHAPDAPGARATERTGLVSRVVAWLRAGYPAGLPEQDFVPLLALLRRRLSDEEVMAVSERLEAEGGLPASRLDVAAAIAGVTSEMPSDEDVERVRAYLAAHGWPDGFRI